MEKENQGQETYRMLSWVNTRGGPDARNSEGLKEAIQMVSEMIAAQQQTGEEPVEIDRLHGRGCYSDDPVCAALLDVLAMLCKQLNSMRPIPKPD
jgi:hypothetical protein